jgi:hypothetical protein
MTAILSSELAHRLEHDSPYLHRLRNQIGTAGDCAPVTGNPEVIGSSAGSVPRNALVVIKEANSRVVGNPEVRH